jgi:hypothetical protein
MEKLRVRVYNVGFGDAILISIPDRDDSGHTETRHILIDVGNAYRSKEGGVGHQDFFFAPVVKDIVQVLGGRPLDLYVMTHEHYDHVQGLPYADEKVFPGEDLKQKLQVHHAWFTSSADPGYYDTHPDAQEKKLELEQSYRAIERFLQAAPEYEDPFVSALMLINDGLALGALALSTDDSVKWLRGLAGGQASIPRAALRDLGPGGEHRGLLPQAPAFGPGRHRGRGLGWQACPEGAHAATRRGCRRLLRPGRGAAPGLFG